MTVNRLHFVAGVILLSSVLAIITLSGDNNNIGCRKWYADAFRGSSMMSTTNAGRGRFRHASSISAGRGEMNDWVSHLEEAFNKSDDDTAAADNNNNVMKDPIIPQRRRRPFQTPVTTHTAVLDLLNEIDNAPSNDLTVVLFFAHYCRTCHRANIPFKQLAYADDDSTPDIHFIRFETSVLTPKQFRSLGIDRVPFLHIYRNGICVASFSATKKASRTSSTQMMLRPRLLENIAACRNRRVADWLAFRDRHDTEIERNKAARRKLRVDVVADDSSRRSVDNDDDHDHDDHERRYRSVRTLTSEAELLRLVHGDNTHHETSENNDSDNGIVVIMFHSHFDQSCLRAQHKYRKIADERQQQERREQKINKKSSSTSSSSSNCILARIESSMLPDKTLKMLGIQRYPHIQIYRGRNKCVASFSIPRSYLFAKMLNESLNVIDNSPRRLFALFKRESKQEDLLVKNV